jgi:hypothetical protein
MNMNDGSGMGILGVIVGAVIVLGVIFFAFGENLGLRSGGSGTTNVKVELPKPSKN